MNNCSFVARIGKDAVVRRTQGGKPVTGWSIAVETGWGDRKQTTWVDCAYWGERGEKVAEYIRKGDRIGVVGELGTREHDGKTYVTLDVRDVTLLGEKRQGQPRESARAEPAQDADDFGDSIPF